MKPATTPRTTLIVVFCLLFSASGWGADAPAYRTRFPREMIEGAPVLVCTRIKTPPKIDGEVDRDPAWPACGRTTGAWVELATKNVSARQTVVYACYDDEKVYLGFVCEEPELNRVRMDGKVRSLYAGRAGPDDSVEAVFEVGGVQGDGAIHAFRANLRANLTSMGFSTPPYGWVPPKWQSAGKFGPNRWMLEMAIPFAELRGPQNREGVRPPVRGDVWGIKLARYGGQQKSNEPRMISTFNVEIPYPLLYICGYNGVLYFEDSNVLRDGTLDAAAADSAWKATGGVKRDAGIATLDAGASITQTVAVKPSSFYLVQIGGEGKPEVDVDGRKVALDGKLTGGFWTKKDETALTLTVRAAGPAALQTVDMRYQPGEEPPGPWCLTNNYRRENRNLRKLLPDAPEGSYRYVVIDYAGRVVREDHPDYVKWTWAYDPTRAVPDVGGTKGWIPFSKGSLTGKPVPAFWQTVNPAVEVGYGRHKFATVDVDLGRNYFVRGLDVLWPAPYTKNIEIWGRPDGVKNWTYLYTGDGEFVEPSKRRADPRGYISVRGIDSVVRYVRWRSYERHPSYPQMDGIQEFWVWGEPQGKHAASEIKPFQPWVSKKKVPPIKPRTWTPDRASAQIVPQPRKQQMGEGRFLVSAKTRIVAQNDPAAIRMANQIRDEIQRRWRIEVPVVVSSSPLPPGEGREREHAEKAKGQGPKAKGEAPAAAASSSSAAPSAFGPQPSAAVPAANTIYLGQPRLGEEATTLAKETGLAVDGDRPAPQGYGLKVTPERVVVLGRDEDGLYWGVQSLMMAMRWWNAGEDDSGPSVRSMTVLDWPGTPERAIYMHKGYTSILNVPQGEEARAKRMFQLLSRFKFNVVYVNAHNGDGRTWPYASYSWEGGTLARICREIRRDYRVEIRPIVPPTEGMSRDWWKDIIEAANDWNMGESDPDESAPELGGHVNICPLHPKTLPLVCDKLDRTLEDYGYPSTLWLWDQAYVNPLGGGRWAQCRRCQRSGKTPEEIYAWFVRSIVEHLASRGTKARFKSSWLRFGPPNPKERRKVALDVRDLPGSLRIDLANATPPANNEEASARFRKFLEENLDPSRTADGPADWPSVERVTRGPWTETEVLHSLTGGGITWGGGKDTGRPPPGNLADSCEALWYAPEDRPGAVDIPDLSVWVNAWWFGAEFPAWRNGNPPKCIPLDLRPFVNHVSYATGIETLKPGHPPEFDLRYLKPGIHTLGGVDFDIIDPQTNDDRGVLMMGRPPSYCPPDVAASVIEGAGPIPVGRKLASIAFLRARWQCALGGMSWHGQWLRPTCRVIYDDDSWLVADCFSFPHEGHATSNWRDGRGGDLFYRAGWLGNTPTGSRASLVCVEWINPYPDKTIREIEFFTPAMEEPAGRGGEGKRVNVLAEAMVAITGIEATPQDLAFWRDRSDRPPLLPPRRSEPDDLVELKIAQYPHPRFEGGTWRNALKGPGGDIPYTGTLIGHDPTPKVVGTTSLIPYGRFEGVAIQRFEPFGATLTFDKPQPIARVELIGPKHDWGSLGSYSIRRQKVDVTVETSRDGKTWERAGELKGISAQADFLPVDLSGEPVKAIRLVATAAPYHECYHPTNFWGGMFNRYGSRPHFAWRLFEKK